MRYPRELRDSLDALRNLLMAVDHVKIDSRTLGSDFEAQSEPAMKAMHLEYRAFTQSIIEGGQTSNPSTSGSPRSSSTTWYPVAVRAAVPVLARAT